MAVTSAETLATAAPRKVSRLNRFDSPWLNPKFLIGLGMVLVIVLMTAVGPLIWETRLALPASSPPEPPPVRR